MYKKLYWKRISNSSIDLLLVNFNDFDIDKFNNLLHEFRMITEGRKPDDPINTVIKPLMEWRNDAIHGEIRPVPLKHCKKRWGYGTLLRWCISEGSQVSAQVRDSARDLWKFFFGSPIPEYYKPERPKGKNVLDRNQWDEWYKQISTFYKDAL